MRFLCVVLVVVFFQLDLNATTLIFLRGPDYVVLGADSAVLGVTAGRSASSTGCKIQQTSNIFVSAAGAIGETKGFSVFDLARKIGAHKTDVIATANQFEATARKPFTANIERLRNDSPTQFAKYCENRECLQIAFASFNNGTPKLSVRSFFVKVVNKKLVVTPGPHMDCPGTCETGVEQATLGVNVEADAIFDRTPHYWKVKGIEAGMDELIGAEVFAHPDVVGPPITILMLDNQGAHFLPGHQGLCPTPQN